MLRLFACACFFLNCYVLHAQTLWQVNSTNPKPDLGTALTLGDKFAVTLKEPAASIAAGDLVSLKQINLARPARSAEPILMLANGDCWPGTLAAGKGLALEWNWQANERNVMKLTAPLPSVRAIWFLAPPNPDDDLTNYDWVDATKKQDTLRLRNSDVLKGTLESFSADGKSLRFHASGDSAGKPMEVANVAAIVFDPSLSRVKTPKTAYAKIVTRNGSRLSVTTATSDGKSLTAILTTGGEITLPLSDVVSLDILQGKATYLADLIPKAATTEPFNSVAWNWKPNRNVKGTPLRLLTDNGEETFDRGIGTHSKTTLVYNLAGKYRFFEALVGLDARTGKKGQAEVSVLVDGKKQALPLLTNLKFGNVIPIQVDLTKAKELTLTIDFGAGGDVQDDVNWGDARLVE